jgi:hypothetical protein
MILARLAALLSIALPLAPWSGADAQTDKGGAGAAASSQEPVPPGDLVREDDIIVTANRYGEAKVAAETEFSEEEIAAQGVDSIQDLITRLTPFIGDGAEEPILLINGRPAEGDRSVLSYPAEALNRLDVLKPEAAAQYGYRSGKRVVNLVLKKTFTSLNADTGASWATAGGQYGGSLSIGRVAINGPTRWNVQARIGHQSALFKNARNIPPRAGSFDSVGFIAGVDGAEIDPALSFAASEIVTAAAIPPGAVTGAPTLEDFAATANRVHAVDPNDFETLQPSRRNMSFTAGVTRPLGAFSASLNVNASSNGSSGLRGLPMAAIVIPAGSPWSPFGNDVALSRPFAGARALRSDNDSKSLGAGFTLSGRIGDWQTSFAANYTRNWTDNLLEGGIDTGRMQALIDAGDPAFNPYGPLDDRLLQASRNRSRGENINARANVSKIIVDLPTGPLTSNFSVEASSIRSENRRSDNLSDLIVVDKWSRGQMNGQMSFSVPLSRREKGETRPLGDLSVDVSLSGQAMSGSGLQKRFGGGVTWSPFLILQLRGALEYAETAPSPDQLDGPLVTTINRIFDFARQEMADIVWITGGNSNLGRGSQRILSLTGRVQPFDNQILSLNIGYRGQTAKGGVASFPELTPVIEAVFPERVTRDAEGRLIAIDARPINIAHDTDAELTSGIALRWPGQGGAGRSARPLKPGVDPWQFSLSLNHRWRLTSELLTRAGVPVIDRLGGDGGQSRHLLSLQITAGKRGVGASLSGNWSSATRVRNNMSATAEGGFHVRPPAILNFSFFVEPERIFPGAGKSSWMKNVKLSLDVQNLFNGYRRVTLDDGSAPAGYSRDEIDPLGRTMRLTVRKRF